MKWIQLELLSRSGGNDPLDGFLLDGSVAKNTLSSLEDMMINDLPIRGASLYIISKLP